MMERFLYLLPLALAVLVTVDCSSTVRYVVLTDVPPSPTVTVIPASSSVRDAEAANLVMEYLIASGVHVVERPPMVKEKTEYQRQSSGTGIGLTSNGQIAVISADGGQTSELTHSVDPLSLISETDADYVIFAKTGLWLKVVKKSNRQVLFAGYLPQDTTTNPGCCLSSTFWHSLSYRETKNDNLRQLLVKLGILNK